MSHFTIGVIVPHTKDDPREAVERLLAPFDEGLDVPEYDRECYCINRAAHNYGWTMAAKLVGKLDSLRDSFHKLYPEAAKARFDDDSFDDLWKEYLKPFKETEEEYTQSHPLFGKPDPDCDECHGTGFHKSTYNPLSKWDWWTIGGRWSKDIPANHCTVSRLLKIHSEPDELLPFYAVVTADGQWHSRGRMGWWGMSSGDKPDDLWDAEKRELLTRYQDGYDVVLVDAHI